jgi:hypothetical protein
MSRSSTASLGRILFCYRLGRRRAVVRGLFRPKYSLYSNLEYREYSG